MANKRKTTTAIVAGVTAVALLLGGTFAWTSISQQAKNEAIVDINPGGRLHDDFNGTNKDVYVENFSSGATGVDIFARIRLDQYFEVGQEAGKNKTAAMADRNVNALIGGDINKVETWETFKPVDTDGNFMNLSNLIQANGNWQWTLGNGEDNLPHYMPTFNMNKDSLAADINGTYEGTVEGDIVHYDDYKQYGADSTATGNEVYDWDDEDNDEEENPDITYDETTPRDSVDVYHKENQTHTAKPISTTATVISMADWLALPDDQKTGAFWVYDEDGWAYWAQAIAPQTTTGLLLDGINMSKVPDDNYYYGINVVGQFATAGDWELLYSTTGSQADAMTDGAKQLMELITKTTTSEDEGNNDDITENGTLTLTSDNADTETVTVGTMLPVEFDTTGLDPDGTQPDISEIVATIGNYDEAGEWIGETELTEDQYTYGYDQTTGKGTLTITDSTLGYEYIYVYDKNQVVEGQVYVSEMTSLELTAEGTNMAEIDPGESVKVFSNDTTADMSAIKLSYWTDFTEDGTPIYTELDADMFSYDAATGVLTILDVSLSDDYRVTDNSGNVSGYVSIYYETDAATLTISYAASGEYSEINQRGYIKPGEKLMLVASAYDDQHINNEDCTWTASCGEGHPCTFNTETGELVIQDLDNDVHPHLITVTCTYVIPETGETLYDEFHIMISDEDLIFTTTVVGVDENTALTTGTAYTLSTTVSTATEGEIDLGDIAWGYSIVDQDGSWTGESTDAAESGDQFMAFKKGTYYVSAYYGDYLLSANTPSAIEITAGDEMSRYYAQVETGYDEVTESSIYGNVTVGATNQEIDVLERIDDTSFYFDRLTSSTEGITVTYDEEYGEWKITVADTVAAGEYTLTYTINGDEQYGIAEQTGTIDLVIDAAEATA